MKLYDVSTYRKLLFQHKRSWNILNLKSLKKVLTLEKRWFLAKGSKIKNTSKVSGVADKYDVYIERVFFIKLKYKQGRSESLEHYRVLALFIEYYNKWYVAEEEQLQWGKVQKSKESRILERTVLASGKAFQEVNPEMGGRCKLGSVFVVKYVSDVLDVKGNLEKGFLG